MARFSKFATSSIIVAHLVMAFVALSGCASASRAAMIAAPSPLSTGVGEWTAVPDDIPASKVSLTDLVPEEVRVVSNWKRRHFDQRRPRSTWRPDHQRVRPLRWDAIHIDENGDSTDGTDRYTVFHGRGCCGGCQSVALSGALLMQYRIDHRRPVPSTTEVPHRADIPPDDDELDIRTILAASRQVYITGGRPIYRISSAVATVGAALRSTILVALGEARPWLPAGLCAALTGRDLSVFRARVRRIDVRFMTVALHEGPVVISGAFNRLERGDDDIYRCPDDAESLERHHFMLVVGFEHNDSDNDGEPDEVVWLVRDDWNRQGDDRDTWEDAFPNDEWVRIVPRGCLFDHGNSYSIVPGTVTLSSFDDASLPGRDGNPVSYCEADPDGDGVPTANDLCPFYPDPAQRDSDGDAMGDACDPCPQTPPPVRPDRGHIDGDGDGLANACDPCPEDEDPSCVAPPPPAATTVP